MTRAGIEDALARYRRVWAPLLLLVLALVYGNRAVLREGAGERGDTRFYQQAGLRYARGQDLYYDRVHGDPHVDPVPTTGYTYLPPFAAVAVALTPVPYRALRGLWLLAMLACAGAAVTLAPRLVAARRPHLVGALAGLLVLRFGLNDLAHGQINWLVTLLLLGCLLGLQRSREVPAGLCLGAALLIKPTTWLLGPWLLVTRRWRAAGACAGLCLGALALAGLRYGPAAYATQLGDWVLRMRRFAGEAAAQPDNASLAAALTRWSGDLGWPRVVAAAGVLAACLALAARRRDDPAAPAALIALSALLSPVTWKAHLVTLLIPAVWITRGLADDDGPPRGAWWGYAALWAGFTASAHQLLAADAFEAAGGLTLGVAALAAWVALRRRRPPSPA